ncbi:TrmB family transcriptional regulator [Halobacteriales archaeon Cl-PHB]
MNSDQHRTQAVEVLQELGLKEYEAKSFVALSRLPEATAKEISETTDVPRTRVYDAIRVLEAKGLVEVQHSNPQLFRAVPVTEAVQSLHEQYESRIDTLQEALEGIEPAQREDETVSQEVWGLSGAETIANRTRKLIKEATDEVVLVLGADDLLTDELLDALADAGDEVHVVVGAPTEESRDRFREALSTARVFVSTLDWLSDNGDTAETGIGRMLLVDRETILVSSIDPVDDSELAVFGEGSGNSLVVLARRLLESDTAPTERADAE